MFEGYSKDGLIKEFDGKNAFSSRDTTVTYTLDPGETIYVKVNIKDWEKLPEFQSEVKYLIYEENGLYVNNYHTLIGSDFNFSCEYNNNEEINKPLPLNGYKIGYYSRKRCGYIKDDSNNQYLTLSATSKKHIDVLDAYLEIVLDKKSTSGSIDMAKWSKKEGFIVNQNGIGPYSIEIWIISNSSENLYRSFKIKELGEDKDHLVRFNIEPGYEFDGIRVRVANFSRPNNMQKNNMARIVLDNISFNH